MDNKTRFENLLESCKNAVERFVFFKINNRFDAQDTIQEVYLKTYLKLDGLDDDSKFKPWILSIARNTINDYYRKKAKILQLPLDENISYVEKFSLFGVTVSEVVDETLSCLADKDKQILHLFILKTNRKQKSRKR